MTAEPEVPPGRASPGAGRCHKLKPGPGHSAEEVAVHQRGRIHTAMIELVAERGYEAVTVRELARRAAVSQRTLYKHFPTKRECFLDTYELIVRCGVQRTLAAQREGDGWRERLHLGLAAFFAALARDPRAAHLALVDSFSAWPDSLARMQRTAGLFDALLADGITRAPGGGVEVPAPVADGIIAGVASVVRERLLTGRERELAEAGKELVAWALSLLSEERGELRLYEPATSTPPSGAVEADALDATGMPLDERSLLLSATAQLVAEGGFEQLNVRRIRVAAGVSRQSFDAHFEDATGCFLAAVESQTGRALAHAARAGAAQGNWPAGVCRTLTALCDLLARDERLATLIFVEGLAAGPAGVRCRARLLAGIAAGLHALAPAGQRPSVVAAEASLGAIWNLAYQEISGGRARRMPEAAGTLAFLALAPAVGAEAAAEVVRLEQCRAAPRVREHSVTGAAVTA